MVQNAYLIGMRIPRSKYYYPSQTEVGDTLFTIDGILEMIENHPIEMIEWEFGFWQNCKHLPCCNTLRLGWEERCDYIKTHLECLTAKVFSPFTEDSFTDIQQVWL